MVEKKPIRRRATIVSAAVIAVIALCALLPATAAADTTSLTLVASPEVVAYNGSSILTGTLMDTTAMVAVGGQPIFVESAAGATGPWTTVVVITTPGSGDAYDTGTYTFVVGPRDKTFYRMRFLGTTGLDAADSAPVSVTPRVYLSKPRVRASIRHGQRFRITSFIQPRHAAGLRTVVKFKFYRYTGGKWVFKKSLWATTSNYLDFTKLTLRTRLTRTGAWKFKAYAPADALHAATTSPYSRVLINY